MASFLLLALAIALDATVVERPSGDLVVSGSTVDEVLCELGREAQSRNWQMISIVSVSDGSGVEVVAREGNGESAEQMTASEASDRCES